MLLWLAGCGAFEVTLPDVSPWVWDEEPPEEIPEDTSVDSAGESGGESGGESDGESGGEETGIETGGETGAPPVQPDVVVDCGGAGDYRTITEAIAASRSGTKIGLAACTFEEDVNFTGKTLDLFGIEGSARTTIRGTGQGSVVTAVRGEGLGTRLAGVTLTAGSGSGAAVYVDGVVLALDDVVMTGFSRPSSIVHGDGVSLTMTNVAIRGNRMASDDALISIDNGSFLAKGLHLECDGAGYAIYQHNATMVLDSTIDCSDGSYGVVVSGGEVQLQRTTVRAGAVAVYGGDNADTRNERMWLGNSVLVGGTQGVHAEYMQVKARNIVASGGQDGIELAACHEETEVYSSALLGGSCAAKGSGDPYAIGWIATDGARLCRVSAWGVIDGEPGFVDAPSDYHLGKGSPLIDAGDPDSEWEDVDGTRGDVGAFGGPEGSGW